MFLQLFAYLSCMTECWAAAGGNNPEIFRIKLKKFESWLSECF